MSINLRSGLIRLAYENPDLRADLLPLIEKHAGDDEEMGDMGDMDTELEAEGDPTSHDQNLPEHYYFGKTAASGEWSAVFASLDGDFKTYNAKAVTDWNKVYKDMKKKGVKDAGAAAHFYHEYRAGRMDIGEAAAALAKEGVKPPTAGGGAEKQASTGKTAGKETYEEYVRDWKKLRYPVAVKGEMLPKEKWEQLMGKGKTAAERLENIEKLLTQFAAPGSKGQNKPQSYYGLPPKGKQASAPVAIENAKKGDLVTVTYKGEKVTGKVVRVKVDGTVTVDLSGKHSDEDVGYVEFKAPKGKQASVKTAAGSGAANAAYLRQSPLKNKILQAVAKHYNTSVSAMLGELTDPDAEAVHEYIGNDAGLQMQVYREFNKGKQAAAAKAPAKLKGKKLDEAISKAYYEHGDRVQVNIMDIGKIYAAGKTAYEGAGTLEEAAKALDEAMKAAITKYRTN